MKKIKRTKWSDFTLDEQFTIIIIFISLFFISLHYILAFSGKDPMIELAVTWITTILIVLIKYSCKSFKGKKESEKIRYLRDKYNVQENESDNTDDDDFFDDDNDEF